jgi:hypothetical protein
LFYLAPDAGWDPEREEPRVRALPEPVGSRRADLVRRGESGKVEKLLRSVAGRLVGWLRVCRVLLLFENSIVCQVC